MQWGHNLLLMSYDLSDEHVLFYAGEVFSKGWSRNINICCRRIQISGFFRLAKSYKFANRNHYFIFWLANQAVFANESAEAGPYAKLAGINASLLRNYINGHKKPSTERRQQILQQIHKLGEIYSNTEFKE